MNGRLKIGSQIERATPVSFETSIDTPVTPPSMKLLERRKPCSPIPAETIPSTMSRTLKTSGAAR